MERIKKKLYCAILILALGGCTEETFDEPRVVTEKILYVSGEIARLTGRVLSLGGENVADHGFIISSSSNFSDTVRIQLGSKSKPGRFYGDTERLNPEIDYFCKSYIVSEGQVIFGNVLEFKTLTPDILSFTPLTALPGAKAKIFGKNFSQDTKVFFGPNEAEISNIQFESRLDIQIPPIADTSVVSVRVTTKGRTFEFEQKFEYIFGTWKRLPDFMYPDQISGPVSLQAGDKYVFGLGRDLHGDNLAESELYELDLPTWTWQRIQFDGLGSSFPFASDGFFGSGQWQIFPTNDLFLTNTWYEYVPSAGSNVVGEVQLKGVLPFRLFKGTSFKAGEKLFVMGGYHVDRSDNLDIWAYDEPTDQWSLHGQTSISMDSEYPFFVYDGTPHIITLEGALLRYIVADNRWEHISDAPFTASFSGNVNFSGISQLVGDKAYIGLFYRNPIMWEYNIPENSWKEKVAFPGDFLNINNGTFTYDGKIYVIRNSNRSSSIPMQIWEFDPLGLK